MEYLWWKVGTVILNIISDTLGLSLRMIVRVQYHVPRPDLLADQHEGNFIDVMPAEIFNPSKFYLHVR